MSRTILIVDDSSVERTVLAGFLSKEYNIIQAKSGEEAIERIKINFRCISAVVLDIVMTGIDGYETLKKIKENASWTQIPVIITTSMDDDASREKAISLGADSFVTKPYNRVVLLHVIQNAIKLCESAGIADALRRDKLTGLLNRDSFFSEAERMIKRHEPGYYIISCFDVEHFKVINDQYGTEIGDKVLVHIANCLNNFVAGINGLTCHYTADRFGILYPAKMKDTAELAENHAATIKPDCVDYTLKIRIGRCLVDDLSLSASALFDRASMAQETIEGSYDTYIADYEPFMMEQVRKEQQIINTMNCAILNGEFEPWLQPQYNHSTGSLIGAEALVRWNKNGKFISPAEFVPVFERNGFIYEMDQNIWKQICALMRKWLNEGKQPLPISVNISRRDLFHKDLITTLTGIVDEYKLPYELIRLEVTESAFAESSVIEKVNSLIELGFTVEIDDFGSGYSSLNTLKDVPASILKLDMRFFEETKDNQRSGNILESVVRMAKWLDMAVIAEGVEEKAQADFLKSIGCNYIQGYLYAKPMPVSEYEKLLEGKNCESKLSRLQTIETLDNNLFWDPKSMETLIFNSYVGGACIFEYHDEKTEILRVNDRYINEFGGLIPDGTKLKDCSIIRFLDKDGKKTLEAMLKKADTENKEASCEVKLSNEKQTEYVRYTARVIARANGRILYYAVMVNETVFRESERKQKESAERLSVIMQNVNGGVSAIEIFDDGTSNLIFHNDKYFELYGYSPEKSEKEHFDPMSVILPESYPSVMEKIQKLKQDGIPAIIDYAISKLDGSVAYIRANCSLMEMAGYGQVIISVLTDVTEKRTMQDQLRAIVDNINGGVTAVRYKDGKPEFLLINDYFYDIIGYTKKEFESKGNDISILVHPDDLEQIKKMFISTTKNQSSYTMEYRIIRRDGAIRNILCNSSVIHLFGIKEPVQLSVINDITTLRETQKKEHNLSVQMSTIMQNIHGGITVTVFHDKNNVEVVFSNEGFYELYGYTKEQLSAEVPNVLDLILPEDREETMETVARIVRERGSATYEYRCRKRNGRVMWTQVTNTVISIEGIGDTVLLAIITDITGLRHAEEESRESADRLKAVMNAMTSGITAVTTNGRHISFLFANDRYYQLHGIKNEGCGQEDLREALDAVHPDDREHMRDIILSTNEVGQSAETEYRINLSDGTLRYVKAKISVTNIFGINEPVQVTIYSDITAEKENTDFLRFLNETSHDILAISDCKVAIERVLHKVLKYFDGHRAYIMEDNGDGKTTSCTYEVCADGISGVRYRRQNFPVGMSGCRGAHNVVIKDVNHSDNAKTPFLNMLSGQGVTSTILVPVFCDGKVCGSMGIDNPHAMWEGIDRLKALGNYIAILLMRRNTAEKSESDQKMIVSLMDDTPGGFVRMKLTDNMIFVPIYANDGFRNMLGMSHDELMSVFGQNVLDGVHPNDREIVKSAGLRMIQNGKSESARFRVCNRDGEYIWLTFFGRTTEEYSGDTYLNVYYSDVTKQVLEEDQQKKLLDNLPCGAALFEYDRKSLSVIHINKRYWELVERQGENHSSLSLLDRVHHDDVQGVYSELENAIKEKRDISVDFRVQCGETAYKAFHVVAKIECEQNGKYQLFATFTPILEQAMAIPEVYLNESEIVSKVQERISHGRNTDGSKKIVLAVDDSPVERTVIEGFLKSDFNIVTANSGEEALSLLKESAERISAVVLDIVMPGMDGYTVMKHMRGTVAFANIPVIVSTCLEDDDTREKAIAYGANGFVTKPFNRALLLHAVRNAVRLRDMAIIAEHVRVEEQQKRLLDNLPSGAALYEYDGNTISAVHINKSYWKLVGREPIEDSRVSIFDAIYADDRPMVEKEVKAAIKEGRDAHADVRVLHGDGTFCLFHINACIIPESDGHYALFASYNPITDQTKQLHEMSFELNTLLHTIPSGVLKYSADDKEEFAYINRNFVEGLGYTENSFRQKFHNCFREMIWHEDREEAEHQIRIQEGAGEIGKFDYRVEAADGALHWFHDEGVKVADKRGYEWYYVTLVDITERKEAENKLRLAEEEYRVATRHSGHTIGRYNIADKTLSITEDAESHLALPKLISDVPYGHVKLGKISPETADAYIAFYEDIMHGKKEGTVTFQKLLKNGWRWITEHSTTIFDANGKPQSAIISYVDITEHQEKEIAFKKWQQELESKNSDSFTLLRVNLNKNASFDTVDGSLLSFSTDRGKEIPLNEKTRNFAMQCVVEEDRDRYIAFVNADTMLAGYYRGKRTGTIEFRARISNGKIHWLRLTMALVDYPNSSDVEAYLMYDDINDSKVVELNTIEQAETDSLTGLLNRKTFVEKFNRVITNGNGKNNLAALFIIDMDGFKQVNDNFGHSVGDQVLIDAGKAICSIVYGGDLVCRLGGDEFIICVRNMPNRDLILKKAKQICALTHRSFSFGVQLTISLGISVFPEDGDDFETLYLKADKALYYIKQNGKNDCAFYEDALIEENNRKKAQHRMATFKSKNRMLIVDDNKVSRIYLAALFKDDFTVASVEKGKQALEFLDKYSSEVAIVLLDLMMPEINGFIVLDNMRENAKTRNIPVIIVSGVDDRETNLRALRKGAYDFVPKPVDGELLRIRVNSAIEHSEAKYLRIQNDELFMRHDEVKKIRLILEDQGTVVVEYDQSSELCRYDETISTVFAGKFDARPLWEIFLCDGISSKEDADKLKTLVTCLLTNKKSKSEIAVLSLKEKSGQIHKFCVRAIRCDNDIELNGNLLLTFTDIDVLTKKDMISVMK